MKHRIVRCVLLCVASMILLFTLGFSLSSYLEKKIGRKIIGLNGSYKSIQVDLLARSILIHNIHWSSPISNGESEGHHVTLKYLTVTGIHLLPWLLNGRFEISHLYLDSGIISYNKHLKVNSISGKLSELTQLRIDTISLKCLRLFVREDTLTRLSGYLNGTLKGLTLQSDSAKTPYLIEGLLLTADSLRIHHEGGEYCTSVKRLVINTNKKQITIDSILIVPLFGKYEFANRLGQQRARINLSIPSLRVNEWGWEKAVEKSFIAKSLHIYSFALHSFKDKRLPFLRKQPIPLPMKVLADLPWQIKIDSIVIQTSEIAVEVFPESGTSPGHITFDKVQACLTGLDNRWKKGDKSFATLRASGSLMNTGNISAVFDFPLDGSAIYTARGSISKMELSVLNDALANLADIRITSGYLHDMSFAFRYTEYTSTGRLDMAYENLHILGLNKNKTSTHVLKTVLIRFFTARDKHKSAPLSQTVGLISIDRNRQKFIFNVWWKSILDGIQSSILGNRKPTKKRS